MTSLTAYVFGPGLGEPDLSPFCGKLLTWLRMAEIDYSTAPFNPMKSPRGKAPYIVDGDVVVSDSSQIIAHLTETRGVTLDAGLSAEQVAHARLIQSALEEHLYFILLYVRWQIPSVWASYSAHVKASMKSSGAPGFLVPLIAGRVRKTVLKALKAQGTGLRPQGEVLADALDLLGALEVTLGDAPFLLGDAPRSLDASAFAMISGTLNAKLETPLLEAAEGRFPKLRAYLQRMRDVAWADAPAPG